MSDKKASENTKTGIPTTAETDRKELKEDYGMADFGPEIQNLVGGASREVK